MLHSINGTLAQVELGIIHHDMILHNSVQVMFSVSFVRSTRFRPSSMQENLKERGGKPSGHLR